MAGTKDGYAKAIATMIKNNFNGDAEAYLKWKREMGAKGGSRKGDELDKPKGFAAMNKRKHRAASIRGGTISRRGSKRENSTT